MKIAFAVVLALLTAGAAVAPGPATAAASTARTARVAAAPVAKPVLPFLHDDYPKAVALARARKVPLFIEAWAPW